MAHISVLAAENKDGPVDQLQNELFILTCERDSNTSHSSKTIACEDMFTLLSHNIKMSECNLLDLPLFCFGVCHHPPTESLTAASCPFFLVHTYFPLLACIATRRPSHTILNMVLALLQRKLLEKVFCKPHSIIA